jgi:phenylacetate-coenzyme A ligase PaaK-like adenylate-forming protein
MRIYNPQREAETAWIFENALNRVDVEAGVFQPDNMEYLTGEYETFIYDGDTLDEVVLGISVECIDPDRCDRRLVEDQLIGRFLKYKTGLASQYHSGKLKIHINFTGPGELELHTLKGRPKRIVDRRERAGSGTATVLKMD